MFKKENLPFFRSIFLKEAKEMEEKGFSLAGMSFLSIKKDKNGLSHVKGCETLAGLTKKFFFKEKDPFQEAIAANGVCSCVLDAHDELKYAWWGGVDLLRKEKVTTYLEKNLEEEEIENVLFFYLELLTEKEKASIAREHFPPEALENLFQREETALKKAKEFLLSENYKELVLKKGQEIQKELAENTDTGTDTDTDTDTGTDTDLVLTFLRNSWFYDHASFTDTIILAYEVKGESVVLDHTKRFEQKDRLILCPKVLFEILAQEFAQEDIGIASVELKNAALENIKSTEQKERLEEVLEILLGIFDPFENTLQEAFDMSLHLAGKTFSTNMHSAA